MLYLNKNKLNAHSCIFHHFIHILSSHFSEVYKDETTDQRVQLCHFEEETVFTTRFTNKIVRARHCISFQIVMASFSNHENNYLLSKNPNDGPLKCRSLNSCIAFSLTVFP